MKNCIHVFIYSFFYCSPLLPGNCGSFIFLQAQFYHFILHSPTLFFPLLLFLLLILFSQDIYDDICYFIVLIMGTTIWLLLYTTSYMLHRRSSSSLNDHCTLVMKKFIWIECSKSCKLWRRRRSVCGQVIHYFYRSFFLSFSVMTLMDILIPKHFFFTIIEYNTFEDEVPVICHNIHKTD